MVVPMKHMNSLVHLAEVGSWDRIIRYCDRNEKARFISWAKQLIETNQAERMSLLSEARVELEALSKKHYWPNWALIVLGIAYLVFNLIMINVYQVTQHENLDDLLRAVTVFNLAMAGASVYIRWQTAYWLDNGTERLRRIFVALNSQGR